MSANKLKVSIIGSNGYIGKNLVLYLKDKQIDINNLVKTKDFNIDDFNNKKYFSNLEKKLIGTDVLFHLASVSNPFLSESNPSLELVNINFTFKILEICNKLDIKNIIFASSGGVIYGDVNNIHKETDPLNPTCLYGIGKLSCEYLLKIYSLKNNINTSILRISNVFGENQLTKNQQGVIPYFIDNIKLNKKINLYGDSIRDYIYITDVVRAFYLALLNNRGFNIYNISTGKGTSLVDLCYLISNFLGKKFKYEQKQKRKFDIQTNILNNDKAKHLLGWKPFYTLESGLEKLLLESDDEIKK